MFNFCATGAEENCRHKKLQSWNNSKTFLTGCMQCFVIVWLKTNKRGKRFSSLSNTLQIYLNLPRLFDLWMINIKLALEDANKAWSSIKQTNLMAWEGCWLHQGCVWLLYLVTSFCGQLLRFSTICAVCLALKTGRNNFCERSNKAALTDPFDLILPCSSVCGLQHKIKTFEAERCKYDLAACRSLNQLSGRPWHVSFWVNKPCDCVDQFQHPKLMEINHQLFLFNFKFWHPFPHEEDYRKSSSQKYRQKFKYCFSLVSWKTVWN